MRIDLRLEGPDFRFGQQVFLFLQFLGLVDGFEDVADAVKEFGACIGEGVSFGFGGEDGADDFALVLDGKGDEVREVRKRVLQFQYRDFRIALVLVGVVFIIGSCINLIINKMAAQMRLGSDVVMISVTRATEKDLNPS